MKKILAITTALLLTVLTFGKNPSGLLHEFNERGFGGFSMKYTSVGNSQQILFGGMGASYITPNFYWGGGGFGTVSNSNTIAVVDNGTVRNSTLDMGYGGFMFGYVRPIAKNIKLDYHMLFGFGGFTLTDENFEADESFFVMEPTVNIYYSTNEWFHVGAGTSYRFANLTSGYLDNSDFNKTTFSINLMFGKL